MADFLAAANVLFSGALAVIAFRNWLRYRKRRWAWVILLYGLVGLYWCGLYVFVLATPVGVYDSVWFGRVFVRPAYLITIAVMLAGEITGLRRHEH